MQEKVDIIGLSGLITPSLNEMIQVVTEMDRNQLNIPVILGGATTSKPHTALKIASLTNIPVIHASDASEGVRISNLLMNSSKKAQFLKEVNKEYAVIRDQKKATKKSLTDFPAAQKNKPAFSFDSKMLIKPSFLGDKKLSHYSLSEIAQYINWSYYFIPWGFKGKFPDVLTKTQGGLEASALYNDTRKILADMISNQALKPEAVIGFYSAESDDDNNIILYSTDKNSKPVLTIPCLRQQHSSENASLALSDYIAPREMKLNDYIGLFALSCNRGVSKYLGKYQRVKNNYNTLIVKQLINRLTEAFSELLHLEVRKKYWGYDSSEKLALEDLFANKQRGIRCAPGYSSIPDHSIKSDIFQLLKIKQQLSLTLTENYMIDPPAAVAGIYFSHSDSRYFSIKSISEEQYKDYLERRNLTDKEIRKSLSNIII
jgi:5-methyltetrahydrofolate--homocysteine methyltransferase